MTELDVTPEALLAASACRRADRATGRRQRGARRRHGHDSAARLRCPSVKVAALLIGHGGAHEASAAMGNEELLRSGLGVAESGISYLCGDTEGAAALGAAGGVV